MALVVSELKSMTVPELKKALLERKLNVVGKKQDLINRLTEFLNAETKAAEPEPEKKVVEKSPVKEAPVVAAPQAKTEATKENVSCCSQELFLQFKNWMVLVLCLFTIQRVWIVLACCLLRSVHAFGFFMSVRSQI